MERETINWKVADKKVYNISARFFGLENMKDKDILQYIQKIKDVYIKEVSKIDTRVRKIEKKVFKTGKHFSKDGTEVSRNYKHQCNSMCEKV